LPPGSSYSGASYGANSKPFSSNLAPLRENRAMLSPQRGMLSPNSRNDKIFEDNETQDDIVKANAKNNFFGKNKQG
jgi:hypothetical protein